MNTKKNFSEIITPKISQKNILKHISHTTNLNPACDSSEDLGNFSLLIALKRRIPSVIVMTFILLSLCAFMTSLTAFAADTTGPANAGNAVSTGTNQIWINSSDATSSEGNYYTRVNLKSTPNDYLKGTSYGFSDSNIPVGASIDSVKVDIRRYGYNIIDSEVCLIKAGNVVTTTNKAITDTTDPNYDWGGTMKIVPYTWSSDELSKAGITLNDIKNSSFGVALKVTNTKNNSTAYVDYMQITVTYSDKTPPTISTVTGNPSSWQKDDVKLTVTATDKINANDTYYSGIPSSGGYSFDNGINWQDSNEATFSSNQTVNIMVKDAAGNTNSRSVVIDKIDKVAPTLAPSQSPTNPIDGSVTITPNASDANGINTSSYKFAAGSQNISYFAIGGTPFETTFNVTKNGTYTVYVKDNAGNENVSQITVSNIKTYTVTFVDNNGDTIKSQNGIYSGQAATAPLVPGRLEYTFTGWDKAFDNITADTTVTAQYSIKRYTLTIKNVENNGSTVTNTYDASSKVSASTKVPTDKYFVGWQDETGSIISYYKNYNFILTSNKILTATFSDQPVNVVPTISLDDDVIMLNVDDIYGKMYFTSTIAGPTGYTPSKCGVEMSTSSNTFQNITKDLESTVEKNSAGQFYSIFNVFYDHTLYVRSYIIDNGIRIYSPNIVEVKMTKQQKE